MIPKQILLLISELSNYFAQAFEIVSSESSADVGVFDIAPRDEDQRLPYIMSRVDSESATASVLVDGFIFDEVELDAVPLIIKEYFEDRMQITGRWPFKKYFVQVDNDKYAPSKGLGVRYPYSP